MTYLNRVPLILTCIAVSGLALTLSGCKSTPQSAFQIMQEQQQLQAQARQSEEEATRKAAPTQPEMLLSLIREAQAQNRHFAALAYVDAYVQQFGATGDIAPLRANALRMTGQSAASEAVYRSLLSGERAAEGWQGLGLLAGAQGDFAAASGFLEKASKLKPIDADILSDLGYARLRAGDISGARLPLGQAAELNPASMKVVANLALLLLIEGDGNRAAQVMTQANMSEQAKAQLMVLAEQTRQRPAAQPVADNTVITETTRATAEAAPIRQPERSAGVSTPPAATPGKLATVRFVEPGAAPQKVAAAQVDAPDVLSPAAVSTAARERPAVSVVVPRVAAASGSSPGMLPPLMELLGNTPLVR